MEEEWPVPEQRCNSSHSREIFAVAMVLLRPPLLFPRQQCCLKQARKVCSVFCSTVESCCRWALRHYYLLSDFVAALFSRVLLGQQARTAAAPSLSCYGFLESAPAAGAALISWKDPGSGEFHRGSASS